jgi:zinc and cadmium transporter
VTTLLWIVASGIAMSAVALVGGVTLLLHPATLRRLLRPMVAFAAGTLLGGALFHMLPGAIVTMGAGPAVFLWVVAGLGVPRPGAVPPLATLSSRRRRAAAAHLPDSDR